jgi:hypothetical protein
MARALIRRLRLAMIRAVSPMVALKAANLPATMWPQLLWLVDPNDCLKPLVFDLKDE